MKKKTAVICLSAAGAATILFTGVGTILWCSHSSVKAAEYQFSEPYKRFLEVLETKATDTNIVPVISDKAYTSSSSAWTYVYTVNHLINSHDAFSLKASAAVGTDEFLITFDFVDTPENDHLVGDMTYTPKTGDPSKASFTLMEDGTLTTKDLTLTNPVYPFYTQFSADNFALLSNSLATDNVVMKGDAFLLERMNSVAFEKKAYNDRSTAFWALAESGVALWVLAGLSLIATVTIGVVYVVDVKKEKKDPETKAN
jgi:hypothetical protein